MIKRKIDRYAYESRTGVQKAYLRAQTTFVTNCNEDPRKKERLAEGVCVICFYRGGRIGGARLTFGECAFCENPLSSGNTCIDVTCKPCALEKGLCCQCGADVNLKVRRKVDL